MKYSSRFFLYAPLALFLALAGGASIVWWREASALSARLDAMNGHEAMPGVTLHFKSKTVSGFPFNLDVVFEDFGIEIATAHGPSSWRAEKVALHALTYGREEMIFEAAGRQAVTWHDLKKQQHILPFEIGNLRADAIRGERGVSRVDIVLVGMDSPALTLGKAEIHARVAPDGRAVEIASALDAVQLSPRLAAGSLFGPDIRQVRLNASAAPSTAFDGFRAGKTDGISALETWRKADGALTVGDVELSWDGVSAKGQGSLVLDDRHAVQGLIDFKVAGIQTLLDKASRAHVQADQFHGIGPALLARAAKAGANDAGLVGAVLAFHSGVVSVGDTNATDEEPLY
ncbi:MAG: DUF2125 domain-containing protein [Alphaproteobacteria bacterium]|nr:DUF2125 domain-containing protein [Alphaproteobacteria bacterium]MBL6937471.1 DUF2125 domain-containing protein [Alphaproteobacteria bacterium]MBL7098809.1 DUF2125 domain-containing protein [Alphaproteobacteria bacterium]